jgi:hypothetical protein
VKARIYYKEGENPADYDSPFVELPVPPGSSAVNYALPGQTQITDGVWSLAASVFDEAGNESDLGAAVSFPFDFTPLPAPTNGSIV